MKLLLLALISIAAVFVSSPSRASPQNSWDGPACTLAAAKFVVCSTEPAVPGDPGQCYVSHLTGTSPDPVEMDMIGLCQAAKGALLASKSKRIDMLQAVMGWGIKLNAVIKSDPEDAENSKGQLVSIGTDLQNLGGDIEIYGSSETEDNWETLQSDLAGLTSDAQVWGGQ